jgi:hypothetical protein
MSNAGVQALAARPPIEAGLSEKVACWMWRCGHGHGHEDLRWSGVDRERVIIGGVSTV